MCFLGSQTLSPRVCHMGGKEMPETGPGRTNVVETSWLSTGSTPKSSSKKSCSIFRGDDWKNIRRKRLILHKSRKEKIKKDRFVALGVDSAFE